MCTQQIFFLIRIQLKQKVVSLHCIFHFLNFVRRTKNALSLDNRSNLLNAERIVFDSQRRVNGFYAVFLPQFHMKRAFLEAFQLPDFFRNLRNEIYNFICNLERRFVWHFKFPCICEQLTITLQSVFSALLSSARRFRICLRIFGYCL